MKAKWYRRVGGKHIKFNLSKSGITTSFKLGPVTINPQRNTYFIRTGITKDQWLEMMSFFDWRCAYSGERLTDKTRSIDHIVPLNSNGDNMIWNCVPMKLNYNSSKHAKDMLEWYREQDFYSKDRLAKIYKWQEYARKKWKNS